MYEKVIGKNTVYQEVCRRNKPHAMLTQENEYGFRQNFPSSVFFSNASMANVLIHMTVPIVTDAPSAISCLSILTPYTVGADKSHIHTVLLNASSKADGGTMNSRADGIPLTATRTPHTNRSEAFVTVASETCNLTRKAKAATVHSEIPAVASKRT